ncbi:MAG TPA: alpha/beta hydrolase [Clostridia bacterium]|nr:alpha/beta hydrolase [Clostridia bacterium]
MRSFFVHNGDVKIHVLENGVPSADTPSLLVIGGLWEPAERAVPILSGLTSHVVAFSFRGRGLSSTPQTGYNLSHHLSDIDAVVANCKLENYIVLGFSRGASYGLGWSMKNQKNMSGLILVDQPPVHIKPGEGYVEYWSGLVYLGIPILNFMRREALEGLSREAENVDFSDRLEGLKIPVSLFVGRSANSNIPSSLTEEEIQLYNRSVEDFETVDFYDSGHMIPDEEQQKYIDEIARFINKR